MNKQILYLLPIFLISLTSALYIGESFITPNELQSENLVWTIIENTSYLDVLPEITINLTNITIFLPNNMNPNSFKIIFLEKQTETIVQTIQVSGGSHSRTKIVNQTIIEKIPEYINNETIKIVENKTIETIYKEIEPPTTWAWILGGLGILLIVGILVYFTNRLEKKYSKEDENIAERRLE